MGWSQSVLTWMPPPNSECRSKTCPSRRCERRPPAARRSSVLLELVAGLGMVEEVSEIREQLQLVVQEIGGQARRSVLAGSLQVDDAGLSVRGPAVGPIDVAETRQRARGDCPARDLIRGTPVGRVPQVGRGEAVPVIAAAVPQDPVDAPVVFRQQPRAIVPHELHRAQQIPATDLRRRSNQRASPPVLSGAQHGDRALEHVHVIDTDRPGCREVPRFGEIRSLLELHAAHELGNQPVRIGVAVRMGPRRRVHRHTGDAGGKVGAVVEVEAAQVILVRLALSAMLARDESGYCLEHRSRSEDRTRLELPCGDGSLSRRRRDADQVLGRVLDVDEAPEGGTAGDDDVGAQREAQHGIRRRAPSSVHEHFTFDEREVDQSEGKLHSARWQPFESIAAGVVGEGRQFSLRVMEMDVDSRQTNPGLVQHASDQGAGRLGGRRYCEDRDG